MHCGYFLPYYLSLVMSNLFKKEFGTSVPIIQIQKSLDGEQECNLSISKDNGQMILYHAYNVANRFKISLKIFR